VCEYVFQLLAGAVTAVIGAFGDTACVGIVDGDWDNVLP
jgi:hypothetical protein